MPGPIKRPARPAQVEEYTHGAINAAMLNTWRSKKIHLAYSKIGAVILYDLDDIDRLLEEHRCEVAS